MASRAPQGARRSEASSENLIARRTEILERLWTVEDAAATMYTPEVAAAAGAAVAELRPLIQEWETAPSTKGLTLETGKTFRYLADALSSCGGKDKVAVLLDSSEAYLRAESLLEAAGDRLELARLHFNYAIVLRNLADGRNRSLMEEARRRYNIARHTFAREKPEAVDQVESALQSLEVQLRALGFYEAAQEGHERLAVLRDTLEKADPNDADTLKAVGQSLEELKATTASPRDQLDQFRSFFERVADLIPGSGPAAEQQAAKDKIRSDLADLSGSLSGSDEATSEGEIAEMFVGLEEAAKRGEVSPERRASLHAILVQVQALLREAPKTPEELVSRSARMHALISENKHIFVERKVRVGRAGIVDGLFAPMRSFLMDEMNQPQRGSTEAKLTFEIYGDSCQARARVAAARDDDAAVLAIEHDQLRPLAYRVRRFGLRHHLTLAEPMWGWSDVEVNPNAVFFAGSPPLREQVSGLCEERGLQLSQESTGWGTGQARWNALRASAVGVFDLTMPEASERASVCHALGSALTLGICPIVAVRAGERIPFDIDLPPLELGAGPEAVEALGESLDRALFALYSTAGATRIEDTARRVLERVHRPDATSQVLAKRLAAKERFDPIEAEMTLSLLLSLNAPGKAALIHPAWPAFYPDAETRRCFHVMPFRQEWSNAARESVLRACKAAGVLYRRGDESDDIQVVHSIWEEICRASHVVVDLTGLNANVCLELAIAEALGRRTLLVARDQWTVDHLFPAIAKLQVRLYAPPGKGESLADIVRDFVAA